MQKKVFTRAARVAPLIKEVVGETLLRKVKDPRVEGVVVTGVDVSPDLGNARVTYYVMGGTVAPAEVQRGLDSIAGFVRKTVGDELRLRYSPKLSFILDRGIEQGRRVDDILRQLHDDEAPPPKDAPEDPDDGHED